MENQFKGIRVYVDMREGGFASGLQVEKRANIFFEYDPARDVERFLTILQKNFRSKDYSDISVTIHLTKDHYETNDEPTHRYIVREGWGAESGFEKRPYKGKWDGYPEVPVRVYKNPRLEMFKAIKTELTMLVHEHAPKKPASEVI